jgi:hypothetical protein
MADLFENDDKAAKELAAMKKQMADLAAKVEAASQEKENAQSSWQEEKAQLEKQLNEQTPWVQAAQQFNKLAVENPDEAIQRILNQKRKAQEAAAGKTTNTGNANMEEALKPIAEKLSKIEEKMTKEEYDRKVEAIQNAVYDSVEYLKSNGVLTDNDTGRQIVAFMKSKGLTDPSHVDLATKSLFSSALMEAVTKKKKGKEDAVVLGTNGFAGDEEGSEEIEEEVATPPRPRGKFKEDEYFHNDKLWKTLEKSL